MMNSQDRNPVFRAVSARMQWTCGDPRHLEKLGLRLTESRTLATPHARTAKHWPRKYRYGLRLFRWAPPVRTYKINLFATTPSATS